MNELVNSATSILPLLIINENNSLYLNISSILFSIISTINHIYPENLDGLTHFVKLLFSNVLFSLIGLNPFLGIIFSCLDLTPLLTSNPKIKKIGELFMQVPRQFIEIYLIYTVYMYNMLDCLLMLLFKIIYFFERRTRIINNTRNDFPIWHSAEHVGLYLLFKNLTKTEFKLDLFICYFFLLIIWLGSSFLIVNFYLKRNYLKRYPIWVKENDQLKVILVNKLKI